MIEIESGCDDCRVVLEPVVELGNPADSALPMRIASVARGPEGHYYVAPTYITGAIARYSPGGEQVGVAGREGPGPGEFSGIRNVQVHGDSLWVFDRPGVTVASLPEMEFERSTPLRLATPYPAVLDGHIYRSSGVRATSSEDLPVSVVDERGTVVRSFGSLEEPLRDGWPLDPFHRIIAPSSSGGIWVARPNRYRVEHYSANGDLEFVLKRNAEWFEPWIGDLPGEGLSVPARPQIIRIRHDDEGRLWVASLVAARDWEAVAPVEGERRFDPDRDPAETFDTMLEVIDLDSREVIATSRFPGFIKFVHNSKQVHIAAEDDSGIFTMQIFDPVIVTP